MVPVHEAIGYMPQRQAIHPNAGPAKVPGLRSIQDEFKRIPIIKNGGPVDLVRKRSRWHMLNGSACLPHGLKS
jgi:hypothetical protein